MTNEGSNLRDLARRWSKNKSIKPGVYNCLMTISYRIDAEMVKWPLGADRKSIRVGETVYVYDEDGKAWHVHGVTIGDMSKGAGRNILVTDDSGQWRDLLPEWLTHERPDSWERIADELDAWCDQVDVDGNACGEPRELARRIRRLAEEREHERE